MPPISPKVTTKKAAVARPRSETKAATVARSAHGYAVLAPVLPRPIVNCYVGQKTREDMYMLMLRELERLLPNEPKAHIYDKALQLEEDTVQKNTKFSYNGACKQVIIRLKKTSASEAYKMLHDHAEGKSAMGPWRRGQHVPPIGAEGLKALEALVCPVPMLDKWGFTTQVPRVEVTATSSFESESRACDRCGLRHYVSATTRPPRPCIYHWGKAVTTRDGAEKTRQLTCCGDSLSSRTQGGCCEAPFHVFKENDISKLAQQVPFIELPEQARSGQFRPAVGLDCEMVYTTGGLELARVSVMDALDGSVLLESLVKPKNPVLDCNTRFSGIVNLQEATESLEAVRTRMIHQVGVTRDTIIVGHGLENDLCAMRIVHCRVIDTALLFPHRAGPPYRMALRVLAAEHLGLSIQQQGEQGHDSQEDTRTALELVWWHAAKKQQ